MSTGARLLAIIGSGETTPTMARVHRQLFDLLGRAESLAVLVDTPYGFQLNRDDISARAVRYFRESVGRRVEVVSLPRADQASPLELELAQARVAEAQWLFSGPGSPTYALRQWRQTVLPQLLAEKLTSGGCIVFSSAAALTVGRWTVPVYEIYKAGEDPAWAEGLNLLGPAGLEVAVIPHYDNAEGGTHDTRYCYLGEQRLRAMEAQLPPEGWALGVDEHTACIFDFVARTVSVSGLGSVTVRRQGESALLPAGKTIGIDELLTMSAEGAGGARTSKPAAAPGEAQGRAAAGPSSLIAGVSELSDRFDKAIAAGDAKGATEAVLELETLLHTWSADTFESDELDRARAALRRCVLRLGEAARTGLQDPEEVAAPWVEALLAERDQARRERRFADADRIRGRLEHVGVEVRDTPGGTEWDITAGPRR